MTKLNKPKVRMVIGKDKNFKMGLINVFTTDKSKTAAIPVPKVSIEKESKILVKIKSAKPVMNKLYKILKNITS